MNMATKQITEKQIIDLLDNEYYLQYVDRNHDLDNNLSEIQTVIQTGDYEELNCVLENFDNIENSTNNELEELQEKIKKTFDIEEDEASELIEEHRDVLRNLIQERDKSDYLEDLLRNTNKQVFYYDLKTWISGYGSVETVEERIKIIKTRLGITETKFDYELEQLVLEASYGGKLVLYFYDDLKRWLNVEQQTISFNKFLNLAIIHQGNGSGSNTEIEFNYSTKYERENLFLCKANSYSYTYEVCDMISRWCDSTVVELK